MKIEQQYPELFAQLNDKQRRAVVQSLAAGWHEGWEPTREDVDAYADIRHELEALSGAINGDFAYRRSQSGAGHNEHRAQRCCRHNDVTQTCGFPVESAGHWPRSNYIDGRTSHPSQSLNFCMVQGVGAMVRSHHIGA